MLQIARQIKAGASWRQLIAQVTPGGGKSALPLILAAELIPSLAQKICWIVPRVALQQQAEEAFLDTQFRTHLKHKHLVRAATNDVDPSRGLTGYVTTYAALASDDKNRNVVEFSRVPYILVLDEPHHIAEDSAAMAAVEPLIQRAKLTLFMSGTLERGRAERIAFLPYATAGDRSVLSLRDSDRVKIINYSRADALAERSIIPLRFTYMDVKAEWEINGKRTSVESFHSTKTKDGIKKALFTGLQTEYALELLDSTIADWRLTKKSNPRSKLLVVAASQKLSKKYADHLHSKYGILPGLATIDEGAGALKAIHRFKRITGDKTDVLVTVGMAYEGLDVKPVTHIACLTRIRSKPWIEQMLARATRFDPDAGKWEAQEAHVFAPDDAMMHKITDAIRKEEAILCKNRQRFGEGGHGGVQRNLWGEIIPVGSGATGKRSMRLNVAPSKLQPVEVTITPTQKEAWLRDAIENHVREYARSRRIPLSKANSRVLAQFGKSRSLMRLDELQDVLHWTQRNLIG